MEYPQNTVLQPEKSGRLLRLRCLLGLVCVSFSQLLYFQDGKKEPNYISKKLFKELKSDKLEIRNPVPTEEGLYVLCPSGLYLITYIRSRPRSGLNIQHFSPSPSTKEQLN